MPVSSLKEFKPADFDFWCAQHLLNRAGFGGPPEEVRQLAAMGLHDAVDHLINYHRIESPAVAADQFDPHIIAPPTVIERMMIAQARRRDDEELRAQIQMERQKRMMADRQQMREIQRWWLQRILETPRPLEEKMTLFWHGHFATNFRGVEDSYHMFVQNQFFRANATGSFADLVYGIIRDPAMLRYLNNDQNRRQSPNENLARELMELFTLGEGNGYTESDIKEGARALTGYGFDDDAFVFRRDAHDSGTKRIFEQTGKWNGEDFCRLILQQRMCSEYICLKLYRYFVNDLPQGPDDATQSFILKLARVFRDNEYAINPVLRALFRSEHFYHPQNRAAVIKTPIQLLSQARRTLQTPIRNVAVLATAADMMGQNLFFPPSVKGWNGGRAWINTSTLFVRQNALLYLITGRRREAQGNRPDGGEFDPQHLLDAVPPSAADAGSPEQVIRYLLRFTLGADPHPSREQALLDFVKHNGGRLNTRVVVGMLALIGAMPDYQLC